MTKSFVLRADERGYNKILSTGATASYVGGHPDAFITRFSSFNFGDYQDGRPGFGRIRVFGDEAFYHPGCSYNMHPHHNFIICAFVLEGKLTHINTLGGLEDLGPATTTRSAPVPVGCMRSSTATRSRCARSTSGCCRTTAAAAVLYARPLRCCRRDEPDHAR